MNIPRRADWIFSVKTFMAAMLALYVALSLDLDEPYWALISAYIVSNPLLGPTLSKGFYRISGTLLGAAGALLLVPNLVNEPLWLSAAIALWVMTMLYLSLLHRSPRGYVFMLAGYTLPLIALPVIAEPERVFSMALARAEEVGIAIVCAGVVSCLFLPASQAPGFRRHIDLWFEDASRWAANILRRDPDALFSGGRQRLLTDVAQMDLLLGQLAHDPDGRKLVPLARQLRMGLGALIPALLVLRERYAALNRLLTDAPDLLQNVMLQTADWVAANGDNEAEAGRCLDAVEQLLAAPAPTQLDDWGRLLWFDLLQNLQVFVQRWQDCQRQRRQIQGQAAGAEVLAAVMPRRSAAAKGDDYQIGYFRDHGLMLYASVSTGLVVFITSCLWMLSGFSAGAMFVAMAAIASCFFATLDQPAPAIRLMLIFSAVGLVVAAFYQLFIFPQIDGYLLLVTVLAPVLIGIGAFIAQPSIAMPATLLVAGTAGAMGIQSRYAFDLPGFFDQGLAMLGGMLFALIWVKLTKPFGAQVVARRLLNAGRLHLLALARGRGLRQQARYRHQLLDRLAQLLPRLSGADATMAQRVASHSLAEILIGEQILQLHRYRQMDRYQQSDSHRQVNSQRQVNSHRQVNSQRPQATDHELQAALDLLLEQLQQLFAKAPMSTLMSTPMSTTGFSPDQHLLGVIDQTIARLPLAEPATADDDRQSLLPALVGLRCGLFPEAAGLTLGRPLAAV